MTSFVEYYGVDTSLFESTGAFNPNLDNDSKLYIDPALVRRCTVDEFRSSSEILSDYYSKVLRLVKLSKKEGDVSWNYAKKLLIFKEIKGTCIGYSKGSTRGNSIGQKFSYSMLNLAKEILEAGYEDPIIFEFASIFEEGIGSDRVSDMITNILYKPILDYTQRIVSELGITPNIKVEYSGKYYNLMRNPFNDEPVLFLPYQILSKLPVAECCSDIDHVCNVNSMTRSELSKYVHFREEDHRISKSEMRNAFLHDPEFNKIFWNMYASDNGKIIDDQNLTLAKAREYFGNNHAILTKPKTIDELILFVEKINNHFKDHIENKGANSLLYHNNIPLNEKHVQSVYFVIAEELAKEYGVDVTRESNNGRGPVDFKISVGHDEKVLVEIKLTSNTHINHGLETQLPEYMKAESARYAYYVVVDIHNKGFSKVRECYRKIRKQNDLTIMLVTVDGNLKRSASKL